MARLLPLLPPVFACYLCAEPTPIALLNKASEFHAKFTYSKLVCDCVLFQSRQEVPVTARRRIALIFFGTLALAGAYDAIRNLPVLSGCYFYAECPSPQETGDHAVATANL